MSSAAAVTAVIAAAGSGERLGVGSPKAFVPLAGRPMVAWSLEAFAGCDRVQAVVLAVPPEVLAGAGDSSSRLPGIRQLGPADGSTTVVAGGATRAESVSNALAVVETEIVAIHDAARPLLTPQLIEGLIGRLEETPEADAVIPAEPITNTVKKSSPTFSSNEDGKVGLAVGETLDRSELWGAQTPQVFRTGALRAALASEIEATDEAMLIERAGGTVLIHPSGPENLKVTTPLDLKVAELLLAER